MHWKMGKIPIESLGQNLLRSNLRQWMFCLQAIEWCPLISWRNYARKVKVLIIDDHPLMRRGIKQLVELKLGILKLSLM